MREFALFFTLVAAVLWSLWQLFLGFTVMTYLATDGSESTGGIACFLVVGVLIFAVVNAIAKG